jgi:hypothetical protein
MTVCYKIGIPLQEVLMQTHRSRLQQAQLELFRPRSEAIHWHNLPREIQQRAITLLATVLRGHLGIPHRPVAERVASHE